jgi:hypothetical protein
VKLLVAALLALGCATAPRSPSGPEAPHLVVPAPEYELRDDGQLYHAEIPFRYTNRTPDTLVLAGCNPPPRPVLEWWSGTQWHFAFDHIELDCLSSPFVMPPGTIIDDTLRLRVSRDSVLPDGHGVSPHWRASRTVGEYRLVWPLRSQALPGERRRFHAGPLRPLSERVSNTFRLRLRRAAAPQN